MSEKYNVRSSQVLSPFGIGQIVNLPGEVSIMTGGLNLWDKIVSQERYNQGPDKIVEDELKFNEKRLQAVLNVDHFKRPFEYTKKGRVNNHLKIPAVRFPGWHYCTNSKCGKMIQKPLDFLDKDATCSDCSTEQYKQKMLPVRFVAVCAEGHIQDVPFMEWVHNGQPPEEEEHQLSYHTYGGSGDLGSIVIKCSCGEKRSLAGIMNVRAENNIVFDSALANIGLSDEEKGNFSADNPNDNNPNGLYCKGHRPWLGNNAENINCGRHLQVLIRGASNVHFGVTRSAIFLPDVAEGIKKYALEAIEEKGKDTLQNMYEIDDGQVALPALLQSTKVITDNLCALDQLKQEVIDILLVDDEEQVDDSETGIRFDEYNFFNKGLDSEYYSLKAIVKTFENYDGADFLKKYFDHVVLIEKLKETRVFTGFRRINPSNPSNPEQLSTEAVNWLPAIEVYGEGVFLKFRDDLGSSWEEKHGAHFEPIIERYHRAMRQRRTDYEDRDISPFFIMMHTFAHLLIKRLCFDCGYGSSSLRERIYWSSHEETKMNGVLIYTSSGDSEGSLGGLVRMGREKNLGPLIKKAIQEAEWCSADPVCSDIGVSTGQGPDNVNGAACHNCCILPETSCEEFNMLLDRSTIIGTIENQEIGFFGKE